MIVIDSLRNNRIIRKIGKTLLKPVFLLEKKHKEHMFLKKSNRVIKAVQETLEGEKFVFCFGTLLGIIREKKLIGRDLDIDLDVLVENQDDIERIRKKLLDHGFVQHLRFVVDGIGINQEAFFKDGVNVDVGFTFYRDSQYVIYVLYEGTKVLFFSVGDKFAIQKIQFNGMSINIPENPEEVLEKLYGPNWRTPMKKYIYWENPCATFTDYVGETIHIPYIINKL